MKQKYVSKILKEMRNPELYNAVLEYIEENVDDAFNYACRNNISINEWQPDSRYEGQLNQKTVLITVRMFDLWENAIVEVLNKHLSKHFKGVSVQRVNDPIGDLKIIFPDKTEERWEIKTTQGEDAFSGATHSSSKCNNYILISYSIDKEKKLNEHGKNKEFIKELAVFIWNNMEAKWVGKHTDNSSWTTLKIHVEIVKKRPEIVVVGSLNPKKKWCKIIRKELV